MQEGVSKTKVPTIHSTVETLECKIQIKSTHHTISNIKDMTHNHQPRIKYKSD